jgi:preprotein translocase subunit SecG
MMPYIIVLQAFACILLIIVILMQSGRGGGLTDAFASAENMFGTKTNEVMVRTTIVLASIFLVSNIVLVRMSSRREKSLFEQQAGVVKPSGAIPGTSAPVQVATNAVE